MAGLKKLKTNPTHLNNFMSSDVRSGNNPCGSNGTSVGTKYVDWPYDPAGNKDGGEVNPPSNRVVPPSNSSKINVGLN